MFSRQRKGSQVHRMRIINKIEGLHHVVLSTDQMKERIEFFTDKLGMELVALYRMHGVEKTFHRFLKLNDESSIALMSNPLIADIPVELEKTHPGNPGANSAPGTLQHLALKVRKKESLLAIRDRLREKGVPVPGSMDHGMCVSIYFAGLENVSLEVACSDEPIDPHAWIDPEVVDLLNISNSELESFVSPPENIDHSRMVGQPSLDEATGPRMSNYPERVYARVVSTPDKVVWNMVDNSPPRRKEQSN